MQQGLQLGVVTAIAAPAALRVAFGGSGGHAGALLMHRRADASLAAAELALHVEAATLAHGMRHLLEEGVSAESFPQMHHRMVFGFRGYVGAGATSARSHTALGLFLLRVPTCSSMLSDPNQHSRTSMLLRFYYKMPWTTRAGFWNAVSSMQRGARLCTIKHQLYQDIFHFIVSFTALQTRLMRWAQPDSGTSLRTPSTAFRGAHSWKLTCGISMGPGGTPRWRQ